MFCERCGRFCWFRKVCSECALAMPAQPVEAHEPASPGLLATLGSTLGTSINVHSVMSINVNGKKVTFDLGGGITDSLVQQIADRTKLTPEQARELLQAQDSPERMLEAGKAIAKLHMGRVKCPACQGDVHPGKFCSQWATPWPEILARVYFQPSNRRP